MPPHLKRLQFREDSIRARKWFEMTKDSTYLEKYIGTKAGKIPERKKEPTRKSSSPDPMAILPGEININKNRPVFFNNS
jgi:penicillin-binding protein 2